MNNEYFVSLDYWGGFLVEFLDILSISALIFSVSVIINKNPISSLMSLIGLFGVIAVYLIQTGLEFIGFSYLIVYIGAVSILFLFILMLINIRTSELQFSTSNSTPLALFLILLLNSILFQVLPYYVAVINNNNNKLNNAIYSFHENSLEAFDFIKKFGSGLRNIMFVTSNNWDGNMTETSHISTIGNILYTSYNIWLFISSFILLLVMVGAIIITINKE